MWSDQALQWNDSVFQRRVGVEATYRCLGGLDHQLNHRRIAMALSKEQREILLISRDIVVEKFDASNWRELGLLTGCEEIVVHHPRLLRSLSWGDEDYGSNVLAVLMSIVDNDEKNFGILVKYLGDKFPDVGGVNVSSANPKGERIYFSPSVFAPPVDKPDPNLLSVMMPFDLLFNAVYSCIAETASSSFKFKCQRASDIWEDSIIVQDVFSLIYRSFIVVCDFTGRNPNVFYEAGIAHTLGKHVIPIAQHGDDVPFDLKHHRYIQYSNNAEGLRALQSELEKRISFLTKDRFG